MQPFIILTGMHRSNTSMFAQILANSGIRFGARLIGPDDYNPYGHFEDQELAYLHEEVLGDNGSNWRPWRKRQFNVTPEHASRFQSIIQSRQEDADGVWGFKVPHATLLLPYWESFENARFALIFRSPEMVLRSLFRRVGAQIYYKPYYVANCLRTYRIYNELLLECFHRNRERAYLVCSDDLVASPTTVVAGLGEKLQLPELRTPEENLIDRTVIGRTGGRYVELLVKLFSGGRALQQCYDALVQECDTSALVEDQRKLAA